jgi:hypothetical protein
VAVTFAGGLNYLSTTSVPALNQNSAAFTGSIWIYPTNLATLGGQSLIAQNLDSTSNFLSVVGSTTATGGAGGTGGPRWADSIGLQGYTDGHFYTEQEVNFFAQEIFADGGALTLNAWNHLVLTFTASNMRTYVNGVAQGTSTGATATAIAWNRIVIGGFNGDASDAVLYNRELSASEIAALYKTRRPIVDRTGIVGYWPLFAGSSLVDHSGKGRTLTATGTVTDSTRSVPAGWGAPIGTILLPAAATTVVIAGAGGTASAGTAAMTIADAVTATGGTSTAGSAALSIADTLTATGGTATAGTAAIASSAALSSAGATATAGTATVASTLPIPTTTGTTATAGSAALSVVVALTANGGTVTAGAATLSSSTALTATGGSATAGSATVAGVVPIAATGGTATAGAATVTASGGTTVTIAGQGDTATTGAAALLSAAALTATSTTATAGDAAVSIAVALNSSGATTTAGTATVSQLSAASAAGGTATAGTATLALTVSITATGVTATGGDATITGGGPPEPPVGGAGTSGFRRRFAEVSPRRRVR